MKQMEDRWNIDGKEKIDRVEGWIDIKKVG